VDLELSIMELWAYVLLGLCMVAPGILIGVAIQVVYLLIDRSYQNLMILVDRDKFLDVQLRIALVTMFITAVVVGMVTSLIHNAH
jgi:hypothetical protein